MLFTYKKPSDSIINEIRNLAEASYPSLPPATELKRLALEICKENGIDDPCQGELNQALVVINYHLSKKTSEIISNKYCDIEKGSTL